MTLLTGYEELLSWFGVRRQGALILMGLTGALTAGLFTCLTALAVGR
jgi:hypothetical protein